MNGSTALDRTPRELPSIVDAKAKLQALADEGHIDTLHDVAAQAEAYRAYERLQGFKERADHFARLKILAEGTIGEADVLANPSSGAGPLVIGGEEVNRTTRNAWRLFGIAKHQGHLERAMDAAAQAGDLTSSRTRDLLQEWGVGWIVTADLRRRYEVLQRSEGLSVADIARRLDRTPQAVHQVLGHINGKRPGRRCRWHTGAPLAVALGMDLAALKIAPSPRGRKRRSKRLVPVAAQLTGGRWDEAYSRLRKALDEFGRVAGESRKWDDAYAHFYSLEGTIANQLKRDRA